jgi:integrase
VSERLGHSNPNVTLKIYSHMLPADDQRAADEWDDLINGPIQ